MKKILTLCMLFVLTNACQKEDACKKNEGINGKWIWVESVGGIGGWTLTPESEKHTKHLEIDDFTFKAYQNDSLVFESAYDLEIRPDTFFETDRYIKFELGGERAIKITSSELELYELCADCFFYKYKRE